MSKDPNLVEMAVVGAAQGLKGEVRVKSFTGDPLALGDYGALVSEKGRNLTITNLRPLGKDMLVVRFEGVADRTAAEALNGTRLFVSRDRLPEAEEDEFYHADLIGLALREAGETVGRVIAIHDFGAGDVLEVDYRNKRVMIPFTQAAVPVVDVKRGFAAVEPEAAGLLEGQDDEGPDGEEADGA
ncbi:ribosome maturation factor RimM [Mesorhizobium sp. RP14(2022)]|uniref:Ribosome maturation factor RimM n=1 Tax=Mesorhizobium liriopis TaxID=2953882 RepID=A0ABT1C8F8_9HYPH|nr:ribosome maturation factor RimM [Mesorhizobium liriopis]MCO6051124.1 ribosome maturation factor RimM [Mesorhizobium liriopis]